MADSRMNIFKPAKKTIRVFRRLFSKVRKIRYLSWWKKGFSWYWIGRWKTVRKNDLRQENGISKNVKRQMHQSGYLSWHLMQNGFSMDRLSECISDKDYMYLQPFNSIYAKLVNDSITFSRILYDDPHLLKYYYHLIFRNNEYLVLPLSDHPEGYGLTLEEVFRLLRDKGSLLYAPSRRKSRRWYIFRYEDGQYSFNNVICSIEDLYDLIERKKPSFYQLMNYPGQYPLFDKISGGRLNRLRLLIINEHGDDPIIAAAYMVWGNKNYKSVYTTVNLDSGTLEDSYIPYKNNVEKCTVHPDTEQELQGVVPDWDHVKQGVLASALHLREAEYYSVDILIGPNDYSYLSFSAYPVLPKGHVPGKQLQAYLLRKLNYKQSLPEKELTVKKVFIAVRDRILNRIFCERGFSRYWATDWTQSVIYDFFHYKNATIRDKLWCYKRGFLSYRKAQYDLNESNWRDIISDYDYKWLSPINNSFYNWIDDKVTYRYVMEPVKQYAPKYYFHLVKRNGKLCIIPMRDCPSHYPPNMEGILGLLRDKGMLALKQSSGAHGDGFFKLSYENGNYCINNEVATAEAIEKLLSGLTRFYAITEFLVLHDELRKIYSKTVNTIRVMAINRHGNDPKVMHAYMRIGSASTGLTDNVGYGGIFCKIDKDTGRYYEGEQLDNHVIVPCPIHPDSGVLIEGFVPMWDEVCKAVLSVCLSLPQLEFLGFDVVVSDQGVKILEINKHQDLHRSHLYGQEIQDFFKEKIQQKKSRIK